MYHWPSLLLVVIMNNYRQSILFSITKMIEKYGPISSALDLGSGDGWFAHEFLRLNLINNIQPIDVAIRKSTMIPPLIYTGDQIPFPPRSFDLTYAIDVIHHCTDPLASLRQLCEQSKQFVLIKDHTYAHSIDFLTLAVLDQLGNRRFGIPSPYHYQFKWAWTPIIEAMGFRRVSLIHPLPCHSGLLGLLTNRLQYLALWERI